jgi:hypothetical protein
MQVLAVEYEPAGTVKSIDTFVADPLSHVVTSPRTGRSRCSRASRHRSILCVTRCASMMCRARITSCGTWNSWPTLPRRCEGCCDRGL